MLRITYLSDSQPAQGDDPRRQGRKARQDPQVRRADELATAMECRCYHGGQGRTALHVLRYQAVDFVVLAAFVALAAGLIVLKHMGI